MICENVLFLFLGVMLNIVNCWKVSYLYNSIE